MTDETATRTATRVAKALGLLEEWKRRPMRSLTDRECALLAVADALADGLAAERGAHVAAAVAGLAEETVLDMMASGWRDRLDRMEAEALSAECETGEVAEATRRSRAGMATAARANLTLALLRGLGA